MEIETPIKKMTDALGINSESKKPDYFDIMHFALTESLCGTVEGIHHELNRCESEIEKIFFTSFYSVAVKGENFYTHENEYEFAKTVALNKIFEPQILCVPQFKFKKYRIDFKISLIEERFGKFIDGQPTTELYEKTILVELDGHDFHEKTKEQAKRDKSKDRCLLSNGLNLMRFTGSEIYNDPTKCAMEVYNYLMGETQENDLHS